MLDTGLRLFALAYASHLAENVLVSAYMYAYYTYRDGPDRRYEHLIDRFIGAPEPLTVTDRKSVV